IEKETYLVKKDELIKTKTDLNKKKSDFGRKGNNWIEPLRNWINTAHYAEKLALSNDFYEIQGFLRSETRSANPADRLRRGERANSFP
ncbi:hypothetical protein KKA66_02255, partial [Patescibacteria group bacterium]|nr:hypothetical protein [Patescibacteria group bacterium]